MNKTKEFIAGGCSVVFSIVLFANTLDIRSIGFSQIGPDFVPKAIAAAIFLLGSSMAFTAFRGCASELAQWRTRRVQTNKPDGVGAFLCAHKLAATMVLMLLYLVGMQGLGFLCASIPYLFLQILLLIGRGGKKTLLKVALVAAAITGVIYAAFIYGFHMTLPRGILF